MKKIGLTACFMYPDKKREVFAAKSLTYMENDMAAYISRKGILPILIPDVNDEYLCDILDQLDGLVLQGGVDMAPESYGETPIGEWTGDRYRDQYELKILDYAIKNSKPVLGICRGFQLMNVYFGGTLYQDTEIQRPDTNQHRSAVLYDTIKHPIKFTNDQFLAKLYIDESDPHVNTVHHQAVKELGSDLQVYAMSDDGLIEAFGYVKETAGKVMGVQWHPEFSATLTGEIIDADKLFNSFMQHI